MIETTEKVYNEILELPTNERVELADKLLLDLTPTNDSVDKAWLIESEKRLKEYDDGKVNAISGDKVFKKIYNRLGL